MEKRDLGVQEEDEDRDILVCRQKELKDAVTLAEGPDQTFSTLSEDIIKGGLSKTIIDNPILELFR